MPDPRESTRRFRRRSREYVASSARCSSVTGGWGMEVGENAGLGTNDQGSGGVAARASPIATVDDPAITSHPPLVGHASSSFDVAVESVGRARDAGPRPGEILFYRFDLGRRPAWSFSTCPPVGGLAFRAWPDRPGLIAETGGQGGLAGHAGSGPPEGARRAGGDIQPSPTRTPEVTRPRASSLHHSPADIRAMDPTPSPSTGMKAVYARQEGRQVERREKRANPGNHWGWRRESGWLSSSSFSLRGRRWRAKRDG